MSPETDKALLDNLRVVINNCAKYGITKSEILKLIDEELCSHAGWNDSDYCYDCQDWLSPEESRKLQKERGNRSLRKERDKTIDKAEFMFSSKSETQSRYVGGSTADKR